MAITRTSFINPDKSQLKLISGILAIIFASWSWLFYQHWQMNGQVAMPMWMPPADLFAWGFQDFLLIFSMWAVMMAAMMLPSALPMIDSYRFICLKRKQNPLVNSGIFTLAYFLAWLLFSGGLTLLQWLFHGLGWLSPMMKPESGILSALIFFVAGAYQFSPLKQNCLKHCQSPFGFLLNHWQEGAKGALSMGFQHGAVCVGCCWAQMLLMFALGVMSILAMAFLTLLICLEKLLPINPKRLSQAGGVLFMGCGAASLFY